MAPAAQRITRRTPFNGRLLRVEVDRAREPSSRGGYGPEVHREVVRHPGAVAIVAVTPGREVLMVRQYRYAAGKPLLEVPAGTLEAGEPPSAAALRELREETGYRAANLSALGAFFSAPGFCDEVIHLFYADGLTPGEPDPDVGEDIELVALPFEEARRRFVGGGFEDAKTLAALGLLFARQAGSPPRR